MARRTDLRRLAAGALAVALLSGCGEWEQADEFQQRLRCGMLPAEIAALAEQFGVESFRPAEAPHEYTTHVLNQNGTFFEFFVSEDGLETVRRGASVGPTTGTSYEPRVNLCTGEVTDDLSLTLKGTEELAGAAILVDGERYGHLSSVPDYQMNIGISTGPHEIRIEQEGYQPIIVPVNYGAETVADEIDLPAPVEESG